jgi:hypothetical protein
LISYLIAKYVDDLSRNEPRNVGIIVYDGTTALARFDGEGDRPGKIDLRRVRSRVTGTQAYRAWVQYWRAALERPAEVDGSLEGASSGDRRVMEYLLERPSSDFYLERGGTILLDAEPRELELTLEDLFARLVREPDAPTPKSLSDKSRTALLAAGAPLDDEQRFQEQVRVPLVTHGVTIEEEVSYAVMNGKRHLLQEMPFDPGRPRVSRKEASHVAFLFEYSPDLKDNGVILYDQSDITAGQYKLLEMLRMYALTIDVANLDHAAETLNERLSLG